MLSPWLGTARVASETPEWGHLEGELSWQREQRVQRPCDGHMGTWIQQTRSQRVDVQS